MNFQRITFLTYGILISAFAVESAKELSVVSTSSSLSNLASLWRSSYAYYTSGFSPDNTLWIRNSLISSSESAVVAMEEGRADMVFTNYPIDQLSTVPTHLYVENQAVLSRLVAQRSSIRSLPLGAQATVFTYNLPWQSVNNGASGLATLTGNDEVSVEDGFVPVPLTLTNNALLALFRGQLNIWSDIRITGVNTHLNVTYLNDKPIRLISQDNFQGDTFTIASFLSRIDGNGTAASREGWLARLSQLQIPQVNDADAVCNYVSENLFSISFVGLAESLKYALATAVLYDQNGDTVSANLETIKISLQNVSLATPGSFDPAKYSVPLLQSVNLNAYPIVSLLYMYVMPLRPADCSLNMDLLRFMYWTQSDTYAEIAANNNSIAIISEEDFLLLMESNIGDFRCSPPLDTFSLVSQLMTEITQAAQFVVKRQEWMYSLFAAAITIPFATLLILMAHLNKYLSESARVYKKLRDARQNVKQSLSQTGTKVIQDISGTPKLSGSGSGRNSARQQIMAAATKLTLAKRAVRVLLELRNKVLVKLIECMTRQSFEMILLMLHWWCFFQFYTNSTIILVFMIICVLGTTLSLGSLYLNFHSMHASIQALWAWYKDASSPQALRAMARRQSSVSNTNDESAGSDQGSRSIASHPRSLPCIMASNASSMNSVGRQALSGSILATGVGSQTPPLPTTHSNGHVANQSAAPATAAGSGTTMSTQPSTPPQQITITLQGSSTGMSVSAGSRGVLSSSIISGHSKERRPTIAVISTPTECVKEESISVLLRQTRLILYQQILQKTSLLVREVPMIILTILLLYQRFVVEEDATIIFLIHLFVNGLSAGWKGLGWGKFWQSFISNRDLENMRRIRKTIKGKEQDRNDPDTSNSSGQASVVTVPKPDLQIGSVHEIQSLQSPVTKSRSKSPLGSNESNSGNSAISKLKSSTSPLSHYNSINSPTRNPPNLMGQHQSNSSLTPSMATLAQGSSVVRARALSNGQRVESPASTAHSLNDAIGNGTIGGNSSVNYTTGGAIGVPPMIDVTASVHSVTTATRVVPDSAYLMAIVNNAPPISTTIRPRGRSAPSMRSYSPLSISITSESLKAEEEAQKNSASKEKHEQAASRPMSPSRATAHRVMQLARRASMMSSSNRTTQVIASVGTDLNQENSKNMSQIGSTSIDNPTQKPQP